MSSQTRDERGDASSLDLRTLAIASLASAVAAIVVSRFWTSGTPFAAAITPVLVTLFKEALDRPTARIAEKVTVSARALPQTEIREPAASHVGRDAQLGEGPTRRLDPTEPAPRGADGDGPDIRVYRQQPAKTGVRGRINPKVALITGLVAFVIAGVVLTAGQLAIGNPFGDDGNGAIILGGGKNSKRNTTTEPQNTTTEQQTVPEDQQTTPQQTTPEGQETAPVEPEQQKQPQLRAPTPTTPQNTTTAPAPGSVQP
jgi:hypothetical protein